MHYLPASSLPLFVFHLQLTPVALMEGMALARTIALNEPTKPNYDAVPSAVFSHPELAGVVCNNSNTVFLQFSFLQQQKGCERLGLYLI